MKVRVAVAVAILVVGGLFTSILLVSARQACAERQGRYDAFFKYSLFLGKELHATPAQIDQGLADLRDALGPRPSC